MELFITAHIPACSWLVSGSLFFCAAGGTSLFVPDERQAVLTVVPADGSGRRLPAGCVLEPAGDGLFRIQNGCENLRLIDWGGGRAELAVDFLSVPEREGGPQQLDTAEFTDENGEAVRAVLYRDGGLRLAVCTAASESSYAVCGGADGKLQLLDVGSERLLIVHAKGCPGAFHGNGKRFFGAEGRPSPPPREMLIALNGDFEIAASAEGESCFIENGYLTSIERLRTMLGHEKRIRYELSGRELLTRDEQIGFFTAPKQSPRTPSDTALALLECILLGRKDEALGLLSPELSSGLGFAELSEFFGEYDEARPMPPFRAEEDGLVCVGTVAAGKAAPYRFSLENGLITDVSAEEE